MGTIDAARFEGMFDAHGAAIFAYLLRRTDRAAAEDALSETFLVAWRRSADLPADEPLPWLYAVARNVLANQRRVDGRHVALLDRLRRERTLPAGGSVVAGAGESAIDDQPGGIGIGIDVRGDTTAEPDGPLMAALRTLAAGDQEVLLLDAWEQLSSTDAGAVLGCSPEAYRARLSRAKRRLRDAAGDPSTPPSSTSAAEATR